MKKIKLIHIFNVILFLNPVLFSQEFTARELVDEANKVLRGNSSHALLNMTITTHRWSRTMEIEGWNRDREDAFILIHAPPKEKGTTTLRLKQEMWLWKPSVERVIKIPATMMQSSWMGSDFTYEDIVKADSIVKEYTHKILKHQELEGKEIFTIEALPNQDAPVVWGKVVLLVLRYPDGQVVPLKEEDYIERGELIRTLEFSEVKMIKNKRVPTKIVCLPHRKKEQKTEIHYKKMDFDISYPENFFSLSRLQKGK